MTSPFPTETQVMNFFQTPTTDPAAFWDADVSVKEISIFQN